MSVTSHEKFSYRIPPCLLRKRIEYRRHYLQKDICDLEIWLFLGLSHQTMTNMCIFKQDTGIQRPRGIQIYCHVIYIYLTKGPMQGMQKYSGREWSSLDISCSLFYWNIFLMRLFVIKENFRWNQSTMCDPITFHSYISFNNTNNLSQTDIFFKFKGTSRTDLRKG